MPRPPPPFILALVALPASLRQSEAGKKGARTRGSQVRPWLRTAAGAVAAVPLFLFLSVEFVR